MGLNEKGTSFLAQALGNKLIQEPVTPGLDGQRSRIGSFKASEIEGARSRIESFNELENIENNVEVHYDDNFNPTSGLNSSVHSQGENFYGSGVYGVP